MEATGGLERALSLACGLNQTPPFMINPRQFKGRQDGQVRRLRYVVSQDAEGQDVFQNALHRHQRSGDGSVQESYLLSRRAAVPSNWASEGSFVLIPVPATIRE